MIFVLKGPRQKAELVSTAAELAGSSRSAYKSPLRVDHSRPLGMSISSQSRFAYAQSQQFSGNVVKAKSGNRSKIKSMEQNRSGSVSGRLLGAQRL